MSIIPEGERVKSAIRWISDQLEADPSGPVMQWVQQAGPKFDLTPKESTELAQFYREVRERGREAGS